MEKITARTNEKIKYAVRLGESASFRKKNGEFFLEGARLCFDAAKNGVEIRQAFFTALSCLHILNYRTNNHRNLCSSHLLPNNTCLHTY